MLPFWHGEKISEKISRTGEIYFVSWVLRFQNMTGWLYALGLRKDKPQGGGYSATKLLTSWQLGSREKETKVVETK